MKLAEALIERSDIQKRIIQINDRLKASAKVQEGNEPPEKPADLLKELDFLVDRFEYLALKINLTNAACQVDHKSLTEHLARRDSLAKKLTVIRNLITEASPSTARVTRSELRTLATVNIGDLRKQVDLLSKQHREVDTLIQGSNWNLDLIE
jgi:uncharacterized coiled-coil DUF342 family protein